MLALEWWIFEIAALLMGLLSVLHLAVQSLIMTSVSFAYMVPLGFAVSGTRHGHPLRDCAGG